MGLADGEEMAFRREVIKKGVKRGLFMTVLAFLFVAPNLSSAAPAKPVILESNWRTGEIEVCYTNVTPGNAIYLYTAKWDNPGAYTEHDIWIAQESTECRVSMYYENGQTIWFYIKQMNANLEFSDPSNKGKITPPITAFIINWPDMFKDLTDKLTELNNDLKDHLDGLATPSDRAISDLQNAIEGLKGALGVGQASGAGGSLQNGFDGLQPGMHPPIGVDDGNGTFTGGKTGGQMPFDPDNNSGGGMDLQGPNPDSGSSNELTVRIPYGVDMNGDFLYLQFLTDEQLEKIKWLNLLRNVAGAIIFILFGVWLTSRFAPQLKS